MEHVARLFIKNEAQDKFEERILDIGTDGRYKAYSYSPNVLMFDRTDGYSVYVCRVCKIPKMHILHDFRRLLAVFCVIFTPFDNFYSVQKNKATKKVTKFGDQNHNNKINHYKD